MNQIFKKWLCVGLCTLLAAMGGVSMMTFAEGTPQNIDVVVQIEGIHQNLYYGTVTVQSFSSPATVSVQEVLACVDEQAENVTITGLDTGYITAVNEDGSGLTADAWDGWLYRVNGVSAMVGINEYRVTDGDHIVLYYSDEYKTGMQFPTVDDSCIAEGVLSFTDVTGETPVPVTDMTVAWAYGDGETATYTTDANGSVIIDAAHLTAGDHVIGINRMTGNVPTVLRLAPDYTVTVPSDDGETTAVTTGTETDTSVPAVIETEAATTLDTEAVTEEETTASVADETTQATAETTTAPADGASGCKASVVSLGGVVCLAVAAACVAKRRSKAE